MGTGGALRLALKLVRSDPVLVLNGDSLWSSGLCELMAFYRRRSARGSILLGRVSDGSRFGAVRTDARGRVLGFEPSGRKGPSFVNAGAYLLGRSLIARIPAGRVVSLERDVFPALRRGALFAMKSRAEFIDIGTPPSYRSAAAFVIARNA